MGFFFLTGGNCDFKVGAPKARSVPSVTSVDAAAAVKERVFSPLAKTRTLKSHPSSRSRLKRELGCDFKVKSSSSFEKERQMLLAQIESKDEEYNDLYQENEALKAVEKDVTLNRSFP